jgi:hypothetical protein
MAMAWDFETDPEFQKELDWVDEFVRKEVEPLDHILGSPYDVTDAKRWCGRCRSACASASCGRRISVPNSAGRAMAR